MPVTLVKTRPTEAQRVWSRQVSTYRVGPSCRAKAWQDGSEFIVSRWSRPVMSCRNASVTYQIQAFH